MNIFEVNTRKLELSSYPLAMGLSKLECSKKDSASPAMFLSLVSSIFARLIFFLSHLLFVGFNPIKMPVLSSGLLMVIN